MKLYNLIKKREYQNEKDTVFICRPITWIEAIQEINQIYDNQISTMFQDVSIMEEDCELPYFNVIKNGVKFTYLVEESVSPKTKIYFPSISLN